MNQHNMDERVPAQQIEQGVEISFSKDIPPQVVEQQVASCQAATCYFCTPDFREKVEGFSH